MSDPKIKHCPCCGGDNAKFKEQDAVAAMNMDRWHWIECPCGIKTRRRSTKAAVAKVWNRRKPPKNRRES